MAQFTLTPIEARTKGEVKRMRKEGFIPVSIQHKGMDTMHFKQETKPIEEFIRQHGSTGMVDLVIEPEKRSQRALVRDVQQDPITHRVIQVTFQQVRKDDILKTQVPLIFVGEPNDVVNGDYMVQNTVSYLDVECEPDNLPEHIVVSIENLRGGDVLRVADLPDDSRYKTLTDPDTVLASLTSTRVTAVEEEVVIGDMADTEAVSQTGEATEAAQ